MVIFHLDDYQWYPYFSNLTKLKQKTSNRSKDLSQNLNLKLLCDVIFPSMPGQSDIPCFLMVIFHLDDYQWQQKLLKSPQIKTKNL